MIFELINHSLSPYFTSCSGHGNKVIIGGADGDELFQKGYGDSVVFGDFARLEYKLDSTLPLKFESTDVEFGGPDFISVQDGSHYICGGTDGDTIVAGEGSTIVVADLGQIDYQANFPFPSVLQSINTNVGGNDTIKIRAGNHIVIGGSSGDTITTDAGNDIVVRPCNARMLYFVHTLCQLLLRSSTNFSSFLFAVW